MGVNRELVMREPIAADSWEDTTLIPAFEEILIRTRFLDHAGNFVCHCHILDHEDRGMMASSRSSSRFQ